MARQREPHGEPEKRPLSPADHIPTPGAVGSALLQVIPRLPSALRDHRRTVGRSAPADSRQRGRRVNDYIVGKVGQRIAPTLPEIWLGRLLDRVFEFGGIVTSDAARGMADSR